MSSLLDPRVLHGALVHFPIALLVATVVMGGWRAAWAKDAYVVAVRAAAGAALLAVVSGLNLGQAFSPSIPLQAHQQAALVCTALALFAAVLALRAPRVSRLLAWGAVVAVAVAGHRGGAFAHPDEAEAPTDAATPLTAAGVVVDDDPAPPAGATVDFARDVAPILERACLECHGPQRARGGLLLTTRAQMLRGGRHGAAIVPGNASTSLLVRRLHARGKEQMPQKAPLPEHDIEVLTRWIDEGAATRSREADVVVVADTSELDEHNRHRAQQHWAFQPPRRPAVPRVSSSWSTNPIDAFVLARLQREGFGPRSRASREARLRRVSLALAGRGPAPEELTAIRSGVAWNEVVDGYLASSDYGVTQATRWLDVARYADTYGAGSNNRRSVRPYVVWVINALNDNIPFDRFVQLQLAADLLEGRSSEHLVATGFLQLSAVSLEGGTDPDANHHNALVDKVSTVGTAFLGLSTGCAACHDHKYDPISQKDFYQLYSVLNDSPNETQAQGMGIIYTGSVVSLPSNTVGERPGETTSPVALFDAFRPTRIAQRGDYRAPGAAVQPNIPAIFGALPADVRHDRLALAQWLTTKNPLFARVTVNRLWEQRFGRGLVATAEDFGSRAAPPSHPELLDWLAVEFIESGYDIKHIEKLILTSETYQQASSGPALFGRSVEPERDPLNVMLGRGPQPRVDAEVVRDAVLFAASMLSPAQDGPSVRSVFLGVTRGAAHPALAAFDMPDREVTCVARTRSTAPQQSLALLNAPEFIAVAHRLAALAVAHAPTTAQRAQHLYQRVFGRDATAHELATVAQFVADDDDEHRWFQVAQALLAQDELVVPL